MTRRRTLVHDGFNAIAITGSNVFKLISILTITIFLARSAGPSAVGDYSVLLAIAAVLQAVSIGGLSGAAIHKLLTSGKNSDHSLMIITASRLLLVVVVFGVTPISIYFLLLSDQFEPVSFFLFFIGSAIGAFDLPEISHTSRGKFARIGLTRILVILVVFGPKAAVAADGNLEGVLILQGVEAALWQTALLAKAGVGSTLLSRAIRNLIDGYLETWRLRKLWLSSIVAALSQRLDLFIVAAFLGSASSGQYSTASRPVEAAVIFVGGVISVLFNDLIRRSGTAEDYGQASRRASRIVFTLGVVVAVVLVLYGPHVIVWLYGPDFTVAGNVLAVYAVAIIFTYQRQLIGRILIIESAYGYSLLSNAVFLGVNALLNVIMVPNFGIMGAAVAAVLSHPISLVLTFATTRRGRDLLVLGAGAAVVSRDSIEKAARRTLNLRRKAEE